MKIILSKNRNRSVETIESEELLNRNRLKIRKKLKTRLIYYNFKTMIVDLVGLYLNKI